MTTTGATSKREAAIIIARNLLDDLKARGCSSAMYYPYPRTEFEHGEYCAHHLQHALWCVENEWSEDSLDVLQHTIKFVKDNPVRPSM